MRRAGWLSACLIAMPAVAADAPPPPADAEFLEFLAESAGEDEEFVEFMESRHFERELERAERERAAAKDEDDEDR